MGHNLTCTFGYGIKVIDEEKESLISSEELDELDALHSDKTSCIYLEFGGTDDCIAKFILHKDSIVYSDWDDYEIDNLDLTRKLCRSYEYELELSKELKTSLNIEINTEYYKWYMIPLWF